MAGPGRGRRASSRATTSRSSGRSRLRHIGFVHHRPAVARRRGPDPARPAAADVHPRASPRRRSIWFGFLTQMHERYAYGALIFLLLLIPERRIAWLYLAFGVVFTLNLLVGRAADTDLQGAGCRSAGRLSIVGSFAMIAITFLTLIWMTVASDRRGPATRTIGSRSTAERRRYSPPRDQRASSRHRAADPTGSTSLVAIAAIVAVGVLLWLGLGLTFFADEWAVIADRAVTADRPAAPVQRALAGGHDRRLPGDARGWSGWARTCPTWRCWRSSTRRSRSWSTRSSGAARCRGVAVGDHAHRAALRERLREPVLGRPDRLRRGDGAGPRGAPAARRRADAPGPGRAAAATGLLIVAVMTSGFGLFMLGLVGLDVLLDPRRRKWVVPLLHPGRALRGVVPDPRPERDRDVREPVHARDPRCAAPVHRRWDGDGVRIRGRRWARCSGGS